MHALAMMLYQVLLPYGTCNVLNDLRGAWIPLDLIVFCVRCVQDYVGSDLVIY